MQSTTSIKERVKNYLKHSDWYLRFRYNRKTLAVWKLFRREAAYTLRQQQTFYAALLQGLRNNNYTIFDIGANEGFTTTLFAKKAALVVAVEPSPSNAQILGSRFYNQPHVRIEQKAVSDSVGVETLFMEQGTALNTLNESWKDYLESGDYKLTRQFINALNVETISLAALLDKYGLPAFIKIDTEGYEKKVISTLNISVPQILFEAVLPKFLEETIYSIEHIECLDKDTVFNFAIRDELVLPAFISKTDLLPMLLKVDSTIDIVCRMSNYREYYV